jgi:type II secretory pathway pseudopilin PulG
VRRTIQSRAAALAGFTILEILIASAIMAIGLVMILGLFPYGIKVGRQVVEDAQAVNIARSVAEALRAGMRNHSRSEDRDGSSVTYFLFQHDGVRDRAPPESARESPAHDYYILLPRHRNDRTFDAGTEAEARTRAVRESKTFLYPEDDDNDPNGGGDPFKADDDGDDHVDRLGNRGVLVSKVYHMGEIFPKETDEGPQVLDDQKIEVLKQYSFAFTIRPSFFDANLNQDQDSNSFKPGNELYHVRVMVFRAFDQNFVPSRGGEPAQPVPPIFELDFEVSR